jgi:wyosine [tRNA(Phe)-imidazoG37] synthetase (radical SAM superfamily)
MISHPFVYGPVPSRRLGLSLGINIIPRKTCTLDCVYCQCGATTRKTVKRERFFPVKNILDAVRDAVGRARTEFLTFSGEGEPTLNADIGRLIRALKREFTIPVAVLTNSTLLNDPQVRRDLYPADLVVPSLDAADQRVFARVDRCHRDLDVAAIIDGLRAFRRYYRGRLWLEIMLVKDVNDSPEHLVLLRRAAQLIRPDRVQLNTVVRPPAVATARPLSHDDLEQVRLLFGPGTEIAESPIKPKQRRFRGAPEAAITAFVTGRPATPEDLSRALGIAPAAVKSALARLVRSRRIRRVEFWGKVFYEAG